jgi:hypothetical protein
VGPFEHEAAFRRRMIQIKSVADLMFQQTEAILGFLQNTEILALIDEDDWIEYITGGQREPTRPGENELVALNATLERLFEFADIKDSDAPEKIRTPPKLVQSRTAFQTSCVNRPPGSWTVTVLPVAGFT